MPETMDERINKKVSRRGYLKYAGVAVVGAAVGAGLTYASGRYGWIPGLTRTVTQTLTQTITERITKTTTQRLTSLHGRLFFDYNGNGIQDGEEPAVPKAKVGLKDNTGKVIAEAVTDSAGDYKLEDVPIGSYKLYVEADKKFRYMCRSVEEFRAVTDGYSVLLNESGKMDIGLMEGFLTLPFSSKTKYSIGRFYDWNPDPRTSLWWNGIIGTDPNNHIGIDYDMNEGEDVISSAPGIVNYIGSDAGGIFVVLRHGNLFTDYGHLSESLVNVGQIVPRGKIIAKSGSERNIYPHLHFHLAEGSNGPGNKLLDPYRPLFEMKSKYNGYWSFTQAGIQGGAPRWVSYDSPDNPNLLNYWTKDNDPHFPSPTFPIIEGTLPMG